MYSATFVRTGQMGHYIKQAYGEEKFTFGYNLSSYISIIIQSCVVDVER